MHRGMCRAIFLQHSFHNIVFSSFFFLLLLLILLFFSSSLSYRFQPRFHESLRRILDRISIDGPLLDFAYSPPPCLFARSRSYLKRSFRRKPWTLRAFRVKSWTDLRINYSAHVSPGCALVCRVRTKSLPPASRFPHFRGHEFHFSLSLSSPLTLVRSFLVLVAFFRARPTRPSLARNEIRCVLDVITRRDTRSFERLPPFLFPRAKFFSLHASSIFVAQFRALRWNIYHNWTTIE